MVELTLGNEEGTPFTLSLQPLTAFAELSYGRRDFAKAEGRKTEKGMGKRVGKKHSEILERRNLARRTTEQE